MTTAQPRYDQELQQFLLDHPEIERRSLTPQAIPELRQGFVSSGVEALMKGRKLDVSEWEVLTQDGFSVAMTTISKSGGGAPHGAIYHIHSGGMVAGDRFIGMDLMADWVERHNLSCATVEYRLAPEHPYPIPLDDCYAGLVAFAETLPPSTPLFVAGMSAGGGLSAGVSLRARDENGPTIAGQLLMCPMLDYRNVSVSSGQFRNLGLWDKESNNTGWNAYLGNQRKGPVPSYASPAHASDLTRLPPTFLDVGALEVFRSEIVEYAEKLAIADVSVEFHLWAGAFHGFDLTHPGSIVSQQARISRENWLIRIVKGHLS